MPSLIETMVQYERARSRLRMMTQDLDDARVLVAGLPVEVRDPILEHRRKELRELQESIDAYEASPAPRTAEGF
jgi:hypothetical protein